MSGSVKVVQGIYDAFNRRDVDGCMALVDPDARFDLTRSLGPYAGSYEGRDAVRQLMQDYLDAWRELRWEPQQFIEAPGESVVVPVLATAVGGGSGIDVGAETTHVYAVAGGLVTSMTLFHETDEARSAAGLD